MKITKEKFIKDMCLELDAIVEHADRYTQDVFKVEELYSDRHNRAYRYDVDSDTFYYIAADLQYVTEYIDKCNKDYIEQNQNSFCYKYF